MVQTLKYNLKPLYISKKLHQDTVISLLNAKNNSVAYRMYCIANDIIERQELFELISDDYFITSAIITKPALICDAKEQSILFKIKKTTPYYKIKVIITDKKSGKNVFNFQHITSNQKHIYNLIPRLEDKINTIWKAKN